MAKGISIAALILAFLVPFVGLILGIVALHQERQSGGNSTVAVLAIVFGALGTFISAIMLVGFIAAFGVFSPAQFTQERCVGEAVRFACASSVASVDPATGTVQIALMNGVGQAVRITGVESSGSCGVAEPVFAVRRDGQIIPTGELRPNDIFVLEVACDPVRGGIFDESFTIRYDQVDGMTGLRGTIEVVAMV